MKKNYCYPFLFFLLLLPGLAKSSKEEVKENKEDHQDSKTTITKNISSLSISKLLRLKYVQAKWEVDDNGLPEIVLESNCKNKLSENALSARQLEKEVQQRKWPLKLRDIASRISKAMKEVNNLDVIEEARLRVLVGKLYMVSEMPQKSLPYYKEAIKLYESKNKKITKNNVEYLYPRLYLADAFNSLSKSIEEKEQRLIIKKAYSILDQSIIDYNNVFLMKENDCAIM